MPKYEWDNRLKVNREAPDAPPESIYVPIGYDGAITDRMPAKGNKHYRKFYMDELEHNKELFPRQPFHKIQIIRGQSRGLSKGLLDSIDQLTSFFGPKVDASGFKTNLKEVGYFKGHLSIYNEEDNELYAQERVAKIQSLEQTIRNIHLKKYGKPIELDLAAMESSEDKHNLKQLLLKLDADSDELVKLLLDTNYEVMLQK